jgi:hypothetical protein
MPTRLSLLIVLLLLSALLLAAGAAHASAAAPATDALALEEPFEGESEEEDEEGEDEEACDEAWVEFDLGEISEAEAEEICREVADERRKRNARGSSAPEECVLRSAHANAAVSDKSNKLKLTLGYTAYEPVNATISVGHIATLHRHLGRSGVLRLVKSLPENQHLKRLVVRIQLPSVRRGGCPSRRLVLFPR